MANPAGIGYPDGQRVVNWDSPVLYSGSVNNLTTYAQSGALDVSRYGYVGGYMQCSVGYCLVTLEWFLDQAMTIIVGQREFTLDQHIANICQPKVPHMGPWLQVTFQAIGNAPFTADWSIFATNRASQLEFVPVTPLLIDTFSSNVPIGGNYVLYPGSYYAGPVAVWMQTPAANWNATFFYLDSQGVNNLISTQAMTSGNNVFETVAPPGFWYFRADNNSGAAGTFYVTIRPSVTGST